MTSNSTPAPADIAAAIRALSPHQCRVMTATETNAADRKLRTPSRATRDAMLRIGVIERSVTGQIVTTTLGDAVGAALVAHGDNAADAVLAAVKPDEPAPATDADLLAAVDRAVDAGQMTRLAPAPAQPSLTDLFRAWHALRRAYVQRDAAHYGDVRAARMRVRDRIEALAADATPVTAANLTREPVDAPTADRDECGGTTRTVALPAPTTVNDRPDLVLGALVRVERNRPTWYEVVDVRTAPAPVTVPPTAPTLLAVTLAELDDRGLLTGGRETFGPGSIPPGPGCTRGVGDVPVTARCGRPASHRVHFAPVGEISGGDGYACGWHVDEARSWCDVTPLPSHPLHPAAPLGTIRFYEGYSDAPMCPCGNTPEGDGFRPVIVTDTADGKVGTFSECDDTWFAAGRHVACLADECLRVWSDHSLDVADHQSLTGMVAPVAFRLHHVAEPATL